jgi:hypothetical protein
MKIDDQYLDVLANYYQSYSKKFKNKMSFYNFLEYYMGLNNDIEYKICLYLDKYNKGD